MDAIIRAIIMSITESLILFFLFTGSSVVNALIMDTMAPIAKAAITIIIKNNTMNI